MSRLETGLVLLPWSWGGWRLVQLRPPVKWFRKEINPVRELNDAHGGGGLMERTLG